MTPPRGIRNPEVCALNAEPTYDAVSAAVTEQLARGVADLRHVVAVGCSFRRDVSGAGTYAPDILCVDDDASQ